MKKLTDERIESLCVANEIMFMISERASEGNDGVLPARQRMNVGPNERIGKDVIQSLVIVLNIDQMFFEQRGNDAKKGIQ